MTKNKLSIFGNHDQNTIDQMEQAASRDNVVAAALMSDGHLGYGLPVGGVIALDGWVDPSYIGYDIACGNAAIKTNLKLEDISKNKITIEESLSNPHRITSDRTLNELATNIRNKISFGIGRPNYSDDAPIDDSIFLDPAWYLIPNTGRYRDDLREKAQLQLGTVGSGNHYVDVFADEQGNIWVGVHFGSRGLGHTIATNFMAIAAGGTWGERVKEQEALLNLDTPSGSDYWALMELAGKYAYLGREWVARKVVEILGGKEIDLVHNHHNFAWKEKHFVGDKTMEVVVVRKGATPAFPNQRGFVGGSMGDNAVILKGVDVFSEYSTPAYQLQENALFSTVHGAGRVMSRTKARGKMKGWGKKARIVSPGAISHKMMQDWLDEKGVILRGGGLDEAPQAYRRLPDVLAAQGNTIKVLHTLKPIIVCMASDDVVDPYKD